MCGIAGKVDFRSPPSPDDVAEMSRRLSHRGPDDAGLWVSDSGACVLAHRRLSVIDLSPLGHQPMVDPLTGNVIVFNGEIYNYRELRDECLLAGARFESESDTEVILCLYRMAGPACLAKLRGVFSIAIWSPSSQSMFLARDRLGKKPLNYSLDGGALSFSSEIDALAQLPGVNTSIDPEALELYLQTGFVPAPRSIYTGIRKLEPAHYAVFSKSGFRCERYWHLDYNKKTKYSDDDALDAFEEKLVQATKLRMIADVPLGALLSGGVDSSVVVALMSKISETPIRTFSIGFDDATHNELPFAQTAAEICKTVHIPRVIGGDIAALLPVLAQRYGEPFADSSAVPSFLVSRFAREHVTVVLNGDGGDELLGGYARHNVSDLERLTSGLTRHGLSGRRMADYGASLVDNSLSSRLQRRTLVRHLWPEARSATMHSAMWNDRERATLLGSRTPEVVPEWRGDLISAAMKRATGPIDRMLWMDTHSYLPDDLLVKMDIASMHTGLEARSPLLDHELIEFCATLEERHKVRHGVGKYLLKRLGERYFPAQFIHRKKRGFSIPLAAWLRGPLRDAVEGTLRAPALMAPLDGATIERTLRDFNAGDDAHASRIWALLMFGQWRLTTSRAQGASTQIGRQAVRPRHSAAGVNS